jgi:hypothetical protein
MKVLIAVIFGTILTVFALFSVNDYIAGANSTGLNVASTIIVDNIEILFGVCILAAISLIVFLAGKH